LLQLPLFNIFAALKFGSIEYERIHHYLIHFNDMLFYLKMTTD